MTKAQQVRKNRLGKMKKDFTGEAKKIFDWCLDLIDLDTKKENFGTLEIYLYDDQNQIMTTFENESTDVSTKYDLGNFFTKNDERLKLFETLKKVIEQEEGFKFSTQGLTPPTLVG